MSILEVQGLKVSFRSRNGFLPVVRGVDLKLQQGETLAIVGESGSGKSVASLAMMGLLDKGAHTEGRFSFQGESFDPARGDKRGRGLAMIFQNPMSSLNPVMRVGRQVAEVKEYLLGKSRSEAAADTMNLFGEVGLPSSREFFDSYPHQLSGGMRQRVVIAVALACDPAVLIADEPTTALDVTVQSQILQLLLSIQAKRRTAIVMVTHDMSVVEQVAHRVAVMYAGHFVEEGTKEAVLEHPRHPYTQALLRSIPRLTREVPEELQSIPGRPPAPHELGTGCPFQPRCSVAVEGCRDVEPALIPAGSAGQAARCLLLESPGS